MDSVKQYTLCECVCGLYGRRRESSVLFNFKVFENGMHCGKVGMRRVESIFNLFSTTILQFIVWMIIWYNSVILWGLVVTSMEIWWVICFLLFFLNQEVWLIGGKSPSYLVFWMCSITPISLMEWVRRAKSIDVLFQTNPRANPIKSVHYLSNKSTQTDLCRLCSSSI